jgi:hypothetical protein
MEAGIEPAPSPSEAGRSAIDLLHEVAGSYRPRTSAAPDLPEETTTTDPDGKSKPIAPKPTADRTSAHADVRMLW